MKIGRTKLGYRLTWRPATGDVHIAFGIGDVSTWVGHADTWLDALFLADELGF